MMDKLIIQLNGLPTNIQIFRFQKKIKAAAIKAEPSSLVINWPLVSTLCVGEISRQLR
jgi:hypothetical protein